MSDEERAGRFSHRSGGGFLSSTTGKAITAAAGFSIALEGCLVYKYRNAPPAAQAQDSERGLESVASSCENPITTVTVTRETTRTVTREATVTETQTAAWQEPSSSSDAKLLSVDMSFQPVNDDRIPGKFLREPADTNTNTQNGNDQA
ncbi:hypothetical protein I302_104563 [Kwoniella bestiolae CBS 10118]|uniref:Uncharacterized protein n=1 Tax=Kwoniella bestiolae CBS 10118 TaxID=1296100 RepID=A0A1B9GBL1_9TREE|nr:hypothetical protein I302_03269 [Kwoniella bestiolae CBS 10118]OCF28410.1 hypothetical protein I302_03269 [Kwoniella bestiolae CBS 10118]